MIFLYIIAAIVALVLLLLLCFLTIRLNYDKTLDVSIGFLIFKFPLNKKEKKSEEKSKKRKSENPLVAKFKKYTISEKIEKISDVIKEIISVLGGMLKHIKIRRFTLSIRVANFDAAKTATDYGKICAAVYPAVSALASVTDMSVKKVDITSAFGESKTTAKFALKIKLRVIILLITAFKLFKIYKNLTEESSNERQEHSVDN